tara:strand:- start:1390 stop:2145 length:756 start_codon:yes stop_codon:yes gene_type:complete
MSRCTTPTHQSTASILWSASLFLIGSLLFFPGCDSGQKQTQVVARSEATKAAHDDNHKDGSHDHTDGDHAHDDADHKEDEHDHDHHSHELPATVEAAIAQLKDVTNKVRKALNSGETDKADDLVHSIGHLMEDLNNKIAAAKLDEKVKEAATAASDTIFEAYGEIDNALHAAEDEIKNLDFSSFGPTITKATKTLEGLLLEAKEAMTGENPQNKKDAEKKDDKAVASPAEKKSPSNQKADEAAATTEKAAE